MNKPMLDEQTKQAISFLDSIYTFTIDATKVDYAMDVLSFLNENKKYTPHSRVLISQQLVYDILNAEIGLGKEEKKSGLGKDTSFFNMDGEGKPKEDIVERTWKKIYDKYPGKGIYSAILNEKFTFEIIETGVDVWLECLDEPEPKKEPTVPEDPVKAFERQERDKDFFVQMDLEAEAANLFMLNKNEEAMAKFEEALSLAGSQGMIFDTYLHMAAKMVGRKKYAEALLFVYRGIIYSQSFLSSGKPMLKGRENDLFMDFPIIQDDGESITSYSIFREIESAIFLLERIPEEEATMPERKRIFDTIRFMVLKLEEWQSKALIE
jgi:hypothetical protein